MHLNKNTPLNRALFSIRTRLFTAGFAAGLILVGHASAVTSFTETFDNDNASWGDPTGSPGGAGHDAGGFITTSGALADLGQGVLFRGNGSSGASGAAFSGNWIADGVSQFSVDVRHNSQVPLSFFARFASPFNFPGATAVRFQPVLANQWTTLTFNIADNPAFGAPDLTDQVWLFGETRADITETVMYGRQGVMPAWKDILGEDKVHVLSGYVYSLSQK